jgi:hypothetical protein
VPIYKDTIDPIIDINDPSSGQEFGAIPPNYDIDITELHFDSAWYIIEGIATTILITSSSGTIDEDAWSSLSNGDFNVTFYAIDEVGNIGSNSVTIRKNVSGIPGAYSVLIFVIVLVGVIGLTWRQKQKLN